MTKFVSITPENYRPFKAEYKKALKNKADVFEFGGNKYLTRYAKYLLEYLEMKGMNNASNG